MNTAEIFPWLNGLKLWFTTVFIEFITSGSLWCSCTTRCTTGDTCMLLHFFVSLNILFCKCLQILQPAKQSWAPAGQKSAPSQTSPSVLGHLLKPCGWGFFMPKNNFLSLPSWFLFTSLCSHPLLYLITDHTKYGGKRQTRWETKRKTNFFYIKLRLVPDLRRVCYVQQELNYNK